MRALFRAFYNLIFGCRHRALSWPLTVRQPRKRTYVVCLACGAEFDYDFEVMQVCRPVATKSSTTAQHEYVT